MSHTWYVKHNGKTVGPITSAKWKQLVGSGRIIPETQLRLGDDGKWVVASKVRGLLAGSAVDQKNATTVQSEILGDRAS